MREVSPEIRQEANSLRGKLQEARAEVDRVIIGMEAEKMAFLMALVAGGHFLIEGVPGLAKTKFMEAFAKVCGLTFGRIQGSSSLTPSDMLGQYLPAREIDDNELSRGGLMFFNGPIFNHAVLCDEVNRITPKAQSGLLASMENFIVVTEYGDILYLPMPFIVCATQNPHEISEGTFPLTDANLDRFMLSQSVGYPGEDQERLIVSQDDKEPLVGELRVILTVDEIIRVRQLVKQLLPLHDATRACDFVTRLSRATRPEVDPNRDITLPGGARVKFSEMVYRGASPRAAKHLARVARAFAFLRDEDLSPRHVAEVAVSVLRHRIVTQVASVYGVGAEYIIDYLLKNYVTVTEGGLHV